MTLGLTRMTSMGLIRQTLKDDESHLAAHQHDAEEQYERNNVFSHTVPYAGSHDGKTRPTARSEGLATPPPLRTSPPAPRAKPLEPGMRRGQARRRTGITVGSRGVPKSKGSRRASRGSMTLWTRSARGSDHPSHSARLRLAPRGIRLRPLKWASARETERR